jgi:hypothetical protein
MALKIVHRAVRAAVTAAACLILGAASGRAEASFAKGSPVLDVQSPALLSALEKNGFGLASLLGSAADSLRELYRESHAFKTLADQIGHDVETLRQDMKANGRMLYEVTDQNVGRIIDLRWLQSPLASFRLVGVINRIDRKDFSDLSHEASCGEVRFIYRLAYRFKRGAVTYASRMPFSLNVVFAVKQPSEAACRELARAWVPPMDLTEAHQQSDWLTAEPLARTRLTLKQVEINAQVVRLPSGMETEFGGQAIYLMRVFAAQPSGAGLVLRAKPLENTPDVVRLKQDRALRERLVDYIRSHAAAIDQGVFRLPDEFLAAKALSFSTFGSARLANHPFAEFLTEHDLAGVPYGRFLLVRSPKGLIERLDSSTCMGCHQANATAGFHFIGFDAADASSFNRVKVAVSPHYHAETFRRRAYLEAVLAGAVPNRFRPLPAAPPAPPAAWSAGGAPSHDAAGLGTPCIPDAAKPNFATTWSCAASACQVIATNKSLGIEMGQCLPRHEAQVFSGLPCLAGEIRTAAQPYRDKFVIRTQLHSFRKTPDDQGYNCRPPKIGVPAGLSYRKCTEADKGFAAFRSSNGIPNEICGLAGGKAFDTCVATNNFAACYGASVVRGNRPTCGRDRFCREDFMCQALPDDIAGSADVAKDFGFCSPTYFLFQMRIDNHPDPLRGVR